MDAGTDEGEGIGALAHSIKKCPQIPRYDGQPI